VITDEKITQEKIIKINDDKLDMKKKNQIWKNMYEKVWKYIKCGSNFIVSDRDVKIENQLCSR